MVSESVLAKNVMVFVCLRKKCVCMIKSQMPWYHIKKKKVALVSQLYSPLSKPYPIKSPSIQRRLKIIRPKPQPRQQHRIPLSRRLHLRHLIRRQMLSAHILPEQWSRYILRQGIRINRKRTPLLAHPCPSKDVEVDLSVWIVVVHEETPIRRVKRTDDYSRKMQN